MKIFARIMMATPIALAVALLSLPAQATVDIHGVNFDLNSSAIRADTIAILHEASEVMVRHPKIKIKISGSACMSEQNSEDLWFQRAAQVRTFLLQHGVKSSQIAGITKMDDSYRARILGKDGHESCSEDLRYVEFSAVP